jgi:hypothetical protein
MMINIIESKLRVSVLRHQGVQVTVGAYSLLQTAGMSLTDILNPIDVTIISSFLIYA